MRLKGSHFFIFISRLFIVYLDVYKTISLFYEEKEVEFYFGIFEIYFGIWDIWQKVILGYSRK